MRLHYGVDTLKLGYEATSSDAAGKRLIDIATHCKANHEEVSAQFGGVPMVFYRIGKKKDGGPYTMAMRCVEWTTIYAPGAVYGPRGEKTPNFMTTFRAEALARYGVQQLVARHAEVMELADVFIQEDPQVSRIDLCADVTGELGPSRLPEFICRSKQRKEWQDGPAHNYYFGVSGYDSLEARLYRKDFQTSKEPEAAWVRGVWRGWDGFESVTRVEFELGRMWCRKLEIGSYSCLTDASLAEAWRYLTCSWMYMLGEPLWYEAASSYGHGVMSTPRDLPRRGQPTEQLMRQMVGLVKVAAVRGNRSIDSVLAELIGRFDLPVDRESLPDDLDGSALEATPPSDKLN